MGSAFEYHADNASRPKAFLAGRPNSKAGRRSTNQYGGTLGRTHQEGHVVLFRQLRRQASTGSSASRLLTIPTATIRAGDMSGSFQPDLRSADGNTDGSNRTAFPNKLLPASRIDPS